MFTTKRPLQSKRLVIEVCVRVDISTVSKLGGILEYAVWGADIAGAWDCTFMRC